MKALVFDTSSVISIVTNNLLWILAELRKLYCGEFYVPNSVKLELVDNPMRNKMYKFEAIIINEIMNKGDLIVYKKLKANWLLKLANEIFETESGRKLHILDRAEVEALVLVLKLNANAYIVDERTMRMLIEDPEGLRSLLESKLKSKIRINEVLLNKFRSLVKDVKVIRSTELLLIAYEKGLLNKYISKASSREEIVDGLLWGLKLRGCAVSSEEIKKLISAEAS